jgi:hypothetical protein
MMATKTDISDISTAAHINGSRFTTRQNAFTGYPLAL